MSVNQFAFREHRFHALMDDARADVNVNQVTALFLIQTIFLEKQAITVLT